MTGRGDDRLPPERGAQSADEPVLPELSSDEQAREWADEPAERSDEWYHRERPPHHE